MHSNKNQMTLLYYLNNLLATSLSPKGVSDLCDWVEENSVNLFGRDISDEWEDRFSRRRRMESEKLLPRNRQTIRKWLADYTFKEPVSAVAEAICREFHLSGNMKRFLTFEILRQQNPWLDELFEHRYNHNLEDQLKAGALGLTLCQFQQLFTDDSPLFLIGFYEKRPMGIFPSDKFLNLIQQQVKTPQAIRKAVLGQPFRASLKPKDFQHLPDYQNIFRIMSNTVQKKEPGVNILLYGLPGTGKTELAKTLCRDLNVPLYSASDVLQEHSPSQRRSDLAMAQGILTGDTPAVLLVDEAEDLLAQPFPGFSRSSTGVSKLFFNHLLEKTPVPVIWISNRIERLDPAFRRRFSYILEMEMPDSAIQEGLWLRSARQNKVKLPKKELNRLVDQYDAAPGLIDRAMKNAALTGDVTMISATLDSLQKGGNRSLETKNDPFSESQTVPFSPRLLHCDTDLEELASRISDRKLRQFSLCLYGVSGSGKSAYARYLADRLHLPVLQKRGSDLLGMYVGQTEKQIAAAFREAYDKKMMLVIDEADSFLQDRRTAVRHWEIQEVNEMLTQMEKFPYPFVCTTNLMSGLDQASLRRFTFKVRYDYLTEPQAQEAFRHFFGTEPEASLHGLTALTPGDFATVAKKSGIWGLTKPAELIQMLREEQQIKEPEKKQIGFGL